MTDVGCVVDAENHIGESPLWSIREQALYWINCEQPAELFRLNPETGEQVSWAMPQRIGGVVEKAGSGLLLALADGIYDFSQETGEITLRAPSSLPAHVKLHEAGCDRQGRLWVGSYDHHFPADRSANGAAWFRLDGDTLVPVINGVAVANGLAFSPDGKTMYAANTPRRIVEAFDLDPATGSLSNCRTFLTLAPKDGHIDGATVDAQGGYWLAVVAKGVVRRYLPDGTVDRKIAMPCSNPTKPAFGGKDLDTMYVTSTKLVINPDIPGEEANGGLFAARPGFRGIPETKFAG